MASEMGTTCGTVEPLTEDTRHKALMTVCQYALDADDAADLMAMLGLDGEQPVCERCGDPMSRTTSLGRVHPHGEDRTCGPCLQRADKTARRAAQRARQKANR